MPTFTAEAGREVYIPFHGMVLCEEMPGGLTTRVVIGGLTLGVGNQMQAVPFSVDVKGTLDTVRLAFIREALQLDLHDKIVQ